MKITAVQVSNVQKVKDVKFEPGESGLFLIGGHNAQGKTSILRALAFLFGGMKMIPDNFMRDGADTYPYIRAELSNGWIVERKGKNADLKITDPTGTKNGQAILNDLLATQALNLGEFIEASDKEKAETLLSIIGHADELAAFDAEEKRLYEERTEVGRDALRLQKTAEEMPVYMDVPAELLDPADLVRRQADIMRKNAETAEAKNRDERNRLMRDRYVGNRLNLMRSKEELDNRVTAGRAELERKIAELKAAQKKAEADIAAQKASVDGQIVALDAQIADVETEIKAAEGKVYEMLPTDQIEAEIHDFDVTNSKIRANKERAKVLTEANDKQTVYDEYTVKVEDVRRRRKALLDSVNLPYPGLSVRNGVLEYQEKSWGAMSGSEQITVACAIISRLKPECQFLFVDKLEQKDEVQIKAIDDWAVANDIQIIGTRVSTGSECNLIIEDGMVVA